MGFATQYAGYCIAKMRVLRRKNGVLEGRNADYEVFIFCNTVIYNQLLQSHIFAIFAVIIASAGCESVLAALRKITK